MWWTSPLGAGPFAKSFAKGLPPSNNHVHQVFAHVISAVLASPRSDGATLYCSFVFRKLNRVR